MTVLSLFSVVDARESKGAYASVVLPDPCPRFAPGESVPDDVVITNDCIDPRVIPDDRIPDAAKRLPAPKKPTKKNPTAPVEWPGTGDWGWYFWYISNPQGYTGTRAYFTARDELVIPPGYPPNDVTIYAPTLEPSGRACLEVVNVKWRTAAGQTTNHGTGWWDHCVLHTWKAFQYHDQAWTSQYVRPIGAQGIPSYLTAILPSGPYDPPCWASYIYNYSSGYWNSVTGNVCGSSGGVTDWGWTMWESYGLQSPTVSYCITFPHMRTDDLRVISRDVNGNAAMYGMSQGAWMQWITTGGCWLGAVYTASWAWGNWSPYGSGASWEANTP